MFLRFCSLSLFSLLLQEKKVTSESKRDLEREYEMHMQKMGWVSVGGRAWVWRRSGSLFDLFAALDCLQRAGLPSSCVHSSGRCGREQLRRVRVTKGHGNSRSSLQVLLPLCPIPHFPLSSATMHTLFSLFSLSLSLPRRQLPQVTQLPLECN